MEIKTNDGPSFERIAVIEKSTGGLIETYEWWDVKGVGGNFKSNEKPSHGEDIIYHGVLENSFVSKGGEYIGDFKRAEWYEKNKLKVYEPYPHGVAILMNDDLTGIVGYYGYTHRGGCTFKIGDKIFDGNYEPQEKDYTPEQWAGWVKEYNDGIAQAEADGDTWWADDIRNDGVARYIPYRLRGERTIENWEDAIQAAKNMSDHLS